MSVEFIDKISTAVVFGNTKMEYHVPKVSYDIDDVLYEMEERGLLPEALGDYNIVSEMRGYFGEEKFMEFLQYSMRVWGIELDCLKGDKDEN
jgi:hypothetical protein